MRWEQCEFERRIRILKRIQSGEDYTRIAEGENITPRRVSQIAVAVGIRVSPEERVRRLRQGVSKR